MDPSVTAAVIAAAAAVVGVPLASYITYRSTMSSARRQARTTQFTEVLKKRIEIYPKLWQIHIQYETHWDLYRKPKTGAWAVEYRDALKGINLEGGVFFSEKLYNRFFDLRARLDAAANETPMDSLVAEDKVDEIRFIVYGRPGHPGLATIEKDDLGSYGASEIQTRTDRD
jgi:hypothetical protein